MMTYLCQKITDNVNTKLGGVKTKDPEFWGLREVISERECDIVLKRKQRKWYTFDELYENRGFSASRNAS